MPGAVPVALVRLLGLLGQLDGISLKIENVSHGFHLLSLIFSIGLAAHPPSLVVVRGGELVTRHDPDEVACFRAKF